MLALVTVGAGVSQAGASHSEFIGGVGVLSPCNGDVVLVSGLQKNHVNEVVAGNGSEHASVHANLQASGGESNMSLLADGTFDAIAPIYDVPFHINFVGKGAIPDFSGDGDLRVFMFDGVFVGSTITSLTLTCTE